MTDVSGFGFYEYRRNAVFVELQERQRVCFGLCPAGVFERSLGHCGENAFNFSNFSSVWLKGHFATFAHEGQFAHCL